MKKSDPLYKKQGLHAIACLFTVEKGETKVLLIKRKNEPYKDKWALVGGAIYNNETIEQAMNREIQEKIGINKIKIERFGIFDKVDRSPVMRMVAFGYIGVIDYKRTNILKETLKTSNAEWYSIDSIPDLAYDHNEIVIEALESLKTKILQTDILRNLFPNEFTIPEIQKVCEDILNQELDRRNFRKKLLSLDIIEDTGKEDTFAGKKPAKLYTFKNKIKNTNIL